jgi:hypothetical protein
MLTATQTSACQVPPLIPGACSTLHPTGFGLPLLPRSRLWLPYLSRCRPPFPLALAHFLPPLEGTLGRNTPTQPPYRSQQRPVASHTRQVRPPLITRHANPPHGQSQSPGPCSTNRTAHVLPGNLWHLTSWEDATRHPFTP